MSDRRWAIGDEGYEVEWCESLPYNEEDQCHDYDNARIVFGRFRDHDEAVAYAKKVAPLDKMTCGTSVVVRSFRVIENEDYPWLKDFQYFGSDEEIFAEET